MVFDGDIREFDFVWDALIQEVNMPDGVVFDLENTRERGRWLVDGPDSDLLVAKKDNVIIGFMGILCYANPFSGSQWAQEHMFYVHPQHRGRTSLSLIREAKKWAKEHDCSHFVLSANTFISGAHESICSLYEKLGMSKFETSYIERL